MQMSMTIRETGMTKNRKKTDEEPEKDRGLDDDEAADEFRKTRSKQYRKQ